MIAHARLDLAGAGDPAPFGHQSGEHVEVASVLFREMGVEFRVARATARSR